MKQFIINFINQSKSFLWKNLQNINANDILKKISPFFFKYKRWILTFLIALALADLVILFIRPALLPQSKISLQKPKTIPFKQNSPPSSSFIHTVNIFHDGPIPPPLKEIVQKQEPVLTGASKKTTLPFKLLGTIENFNPKKSMASIQITSSGETNSYFVGDTIDNKARITKVQRRKVIFMNLLNNQREHLEIPKEQSLFNFTKKEPLKNNANIKKIEKKPLHKGISKTGNNQYSVTRSSLNEHLQQLPDILQKARVEAKYGADGKVLGHAFTWIEKGSIYESLGFAKGDMLISVNGENINNDMEAQKLFQQFRADSQFSVVVQSENGETREISYDINEDASVQ